MRITAAATIALAPFDNLSGDPGENYLAQGFVEDLATELSRFGTLEVLYPRTVAVFMEASRPDSAGEPSLANAHVLRGSVRRIGDVIRVVVQLLEFASSRQLWASRYDATASELLAVQDEIAARVAGSLVVEVDKARLAAARRRPLTSLDVYDCWLRGLECLQRGSIEADAEARSLFERALAIDPAYARAYAGVSLSHFNEWSCQAWEHWDEKERLAYDYARRAAEIDDGDAVVQIVLGRILLFRRRFDEAAHHVHRALALNPNEANVLAHAALCLGLLGDAGGALELARKAKRLNPHFPQWYAAAEAQALFLLGQYEEASEVALRTPGGIVDLPAWVAAAHALSGDLESARKHVERFVADFTTRITFGRTPDPGEPLRWLFHVNPFRHHADASRLAQGLASAGLARDPDEGRPEALAHRDGAEASAGAIFRHEGDFWRIEFDGLTVQLTDQKGFHDLARLLERPDREIHCLELANRPDESGRADRVLDDRARREIEARVRELQREIDEADAANNRGDAERARGELDQIAELLAGTLGLHGRSRRLGSGAERARSAVTWRIRSAIKKIATTHPRLGRHLENSLKTGTFCAYQPETPIEWSC
jgi:TolB-like protein/tetratricopeptide (TPR) repeat protein